MPKYFVGKSVKSNRVEATSAKSFRELVQKHLETTFKLAVTQAEYHALPKGRARLDAKDSPYLVACSYDNERDERANRKDPCNLLFLDLDEDADGHCPARAFVTNPERLTAALAPFNFAAYTTASSTPEKPRMRVVVDAEGIRLVDYPKAVRTIASKIGLEHVTKESLIPNQPMICPSLFADQDPDMEHPMVATNIKGETFRTSDIEDDGEGPVSEKRVRISDRSDDESDGLEFLRARLGGFTLEHVTEALDALNPDMHYLEWVDVAAAMRHQWGETNDEEAAYRIFHDWSSGGNKYGSPESTRDKWEKVSPTPKGRIPVTIRTLIKRASDAGWNAGKAKEKCFSTVMDWVGLEAHTIHDLSHGALELIAGLPLLTSVEEDMLLKAVSQRLKDIGHPIQGVTPLRKDLKKLRDRRDKCKDGAASTEEPAWAKGWCYVACDEQFYRPTSNQKRSHLALNDAFGRFLLPTEEQLEAMGKDVTPGELNKPLYEPTSYLLHHQQCLVVDDYAYDPSSPKDVYSEDENGVRLVNIYRQSFPKPMKEKANEAGALWLQHLSNLIAEPEYQKVLCDYIAFMVQFPGKKIRWAPLIQGGEGCGKTLLANLLGAILGPDNVSFVNNDTIRSQWNDWAFGSQAIVVSEVYVGKNNDVMNRLKDLVTDDRISINQRNKSTRTVENRVNFIMFTNHKDSLALMAGSRRYFVIESALQTEEQILALGTDYFAPIFDMLANNAAGLRAFFEAWDIDDNFPADGRAPKTKYLDNLIENSADEVTATVRRLVAEGDDPLIQKDLIAASTLAEKLIMEGVKTTSQRLATVLRDLNYERGPRALLGDDRQYLWTLNGAFKKGVNLADVARNRNIKQEDWC